MAKRISGTQEWATKNINVLLGCQHQCRYCYARSNALRFKRITDPKDWGTIYCSAREEEVKKKRPKYSGTVMFPTTHDITPEFLDECTTVLRKLLEAKNDVLIVSKPHVQCIKHLCNELEDFKDQILFRFTIGCMDDELLAYWEPKAPTYDQRHDCLEYAFKLGYATSVSAEPMLDSNNVIALYDDLEPFVTDAIWIGKMNKVRQRVLVETEEDEQQVSRIEQGQTDEKIWAIYNALKDRPKVKWKESIKDVVGLPLATKKGQDE